MKAKDFLKIVNPSEEDSNSLKLFAFSPVYQPCYLIQHSLSSMSFIHHAELRGNGTLTIKDVIDTFRKFPHKEVKFYDKNREYYLDLDTEDIVISLESVWSDNIYRHFLFSSESWKG